MGKKGESCIHLLVYRILKEKANGRTFISYDCVREVMHRRFNKVPRPLHYILLKEMEELGLIKKNGNTRCIVYELTGGKRDHVLNQHIGLV